MTFPRKWGKSVNLDMIQTFLSNELNVQDENRELFVGNADRHGSLKALKVASYTNLMTSYQGQFSVIVIDFKDMKSDSYEKVVRQQIVNLYAHHKFKRVRTILNHCSGKAIRELFFE